MLYLHIRLAVRAPDSKLVRVARGLLIPWAPALSRMSVMGAGTPIRVTDGGRKTAGKTEIDDDG